MNSSSGDKTVPNNFKCLRMYETQGRVKAQIESSDLKQLSEGEVVIHSRFSGINYKDALAVSGKGRILKHFPLIPGIDVAGEVISSQSPKFKPGDKVLTTGCGIGENFDGGYSQVARIKAESVINLPSNLSLEEAMIIGTAGFTAALCLSRMQTNGQEPSKGPILISGASGGVGSFAVQIFSQLGYEVMAVSGKESAKSYLLELGAHQVVKDTELKLGQRPLESVRFGGMLDTVGGELLSHCIPHIQLWGNVACVGLAASAELKSSLMPLILRGVSLLGISSNNTPHQLRQEIWNNLNSIWRPKKLKRIHSRTVKLEELPQACEELLTRRVQGRILVEL